MPSQPPTGLCASCLHGRTASTARGTAFLRCERSKDDPRFPKYPALPVVRCSGFEAPPAPPPR